MDIGRVVLIIGAVLLLVGGVVIAFKLLNKSKAEKEKPVNYRAFFIVGISFIPFGIGWIVIALNTDISFVAGIPFLGLGVTYMAIGLANRDKWKR